MPDVTLVAIDDMEPIHGGLLRRARAQLGVTAWGMQVLTLPPDWDGYPGHNHAVDAYDPKTDRWERRAPLPIAVHHTAAVAVGGHALAAGREDG